MKAEAEAARAETQATQAELAKLKATQVQTKAGDNATLAGKWKITYANDSVRIYTIGKDGDVSSYDTVQPETTKQMGRIKQENGMMTLVFEGDHRLEKLTLGSDGRLFVEHFNPSTDFPDKKPAVMGIGIWEK